MASKPLNAAPIKKPLPAPTAAQASANGPHPRPATAPAPAPSSPPVPALLAAPPTPTGPNIVADGGPLETTPIIPSVARIPASSGGGGFGVEEQPTTAMNVVTRKPMTNDTRRASGRRHVPMQPMPAPIALSDMPATPRGGTNRRFSVNPPTRVHNTTPTITVAPSRQESGSHVRQESISPAR